MKLTRLLLLAAATLGTAALLSAGPDARTFMQPKTPAKTTANVTATANPAPAPANTTVATCTACACCKKAS